MNTSAQPSSGTAGHLYWVCQIAGWSVYSLIGFSEVVIYLHRPWPRIVAEVLLVQGAAILLTHLLRAVIKRQQWAALSRGRLILRVLAASLCMGLLMAIITQHTSLADLQDPNQLFRGIYNTPLGLYGPMLIVINWMAIFVFWSALYLAALAIRRHKSAELQQSELARALQLAELRLLKSQLNPHFMFNALNAVRSLIAEDPTRAQDAVTRLANTLRYTLTAGQEEVVSLHRELEIVEDYLQLESLRFEDRLTVSCNVSAEARCIRIPVMMLQTLVENAIKHGIAALPEGGRLEIDGGLQDGALLLQVKNPRPATRMSSQAQDSEGIGLRNTAERLRLLFGTDAHLDVDLSQPALATIRIRIPQAG